MSRYIDADESLRMMQNSKEDKPSWGDWGTAHDCCIDCVNGTLTADVVEVKHGKWEFEVFNPDVLGQFRCSVCGLRNGIRATNYCPHCGAKMDGGDN